MRHQKSGRKLKRTASHRKALLASLCTSLLVHKKIKTTVAKAKEARIFVEKIITKAKNAVAKETSSGKKEIAPRREVFAILRSKAAVSTLFRDIAPKVASRPGGYTRIIKLGRRLGDAAELAVLELVDFNIVQEKENKKSKKTVKEKITKQSSQIKDDKNIKAEERLLMNEKAETQTQSA